jgi:hypothetical protein
MKTAEFTKNGKTIKVTAIDSAGMGFISQLVCGGCYTEEQAFDLCYEFENKYVTINE